MHNKVIHPYVFRCACMLSRFSRVWLFVTLWTITCQAPLSMGFSSQAYWSGLPFPSPGDLPHPGMEVLSLGVSCTGWQILHHCTTWVTPLAESLIWGHHRLFEYPSLQVRLCNRAGSDAGVKSASKYGRTELSSPSGCGRCDGTEVSWVRGAPGFVSDWQPDFVHRWNVLDDSAFVYF